MMPPALSLGGLSDDEDEDGLGTLPASLSGTGTDAAKKMQESFMLSQSGTFKVQDFNIKKTGLVPADLSDAADFSGLDGLPGVSINGIDDFETLNELGSGCSGTVFRARHKQSGAIYAVKQVTILEKPKRDQVVAELRIMRQHQCPWLVALHNAFYEEAKAGASPTCPSHDPRTLPAPPSVRAGLAASARACSECVASPHPHSPALARARSRRLPRSLS